MPPKDFQPSLNVPPAAEGVSDSSQSEDFSVVQGTTFPSTLQTETFPYSGYDVLRPQRGTYQNACPTYTRPQATGDLVFDIVVTVQELQRQFNSRCTVYDKSHDVFTWQCIGCNRWHCISCFQDHYPNCCFASRFITTYPQQDAPTSNSDIRGNDD